MSTGPPVTSIYLASATGTSTFSSPSASSTALPGGGQQGSPKPLLFFVALGFGVVFTNLWLVCVDTHGEARLRRLTCCRIIVGVKYCFRYNQRARAGLLDESEEPIGMNNVQRPRRRREKKLMSMEDVNTRFPLTKYKIWKATRANQGLVAAGGVTASPSRAASVKNIEMTGQSHMEYVPDVNKAEHAKTTEPAHTVQEPRASLQPEREPVPRTSITMLKKSFDVSVSEKATDDATSAIQRSEIVEEVVDDEDEEDPIDAGVAPELLDTPGDACAICIEDLGDEDEVRGLTCGHAFHAGCLDPWLTSRRACCPLCKADYYVAKPRTEGDIEQRRSHRRRDHGTAPVRQPPEAWTGSRSGVPLRPRIFFGPMTPYSRSPEPVRSHRRQMPSFSMDSEPRPIADTRLGRLFSRVITPAMPTRWFNGRHGGDTTQTEPATPTPAQIEAGGRFPMGFRL